MSRQIVSSVCTMDQLRVALVKQDVYQDLYVCSHRLNDPLQILHTSPNRVGPIGLFTLSDTDFYIVHEEETPECQIYRQVLPDLADKLHLLKTRTIDKIPGREFLRPGSSHCHGEFSISCFDVDWGRYDVVITLNASLPTQLIQQFPRTLFAYMIGEANLATRRVKFGYDVCLNQKARGKIARRMGVVDFPYTFVGPSCLEKLVQKHLGRKSHQQGIFAEINSCHGRPVTHAPPEFLTTFSKLGHSIRLHRQLISENLKELYDARYFVKLSGRSIRGNSVIEAISLGTVVLMDPSQVIHRELLPRQSWITSSEQARQKVCYLDQHPDAYAALLAEQRERLQRYVVDAPWTSLQNCLKHKRKQTSPSRRWTLNL